MNATLKVKVAIVVMSMVDTILLVAAANVWLNNTSSGRTECVDCSVVPTVAPSPGAETFGKRPATRSPARTTTPSTSASPTPPPKPKPSRSPTPTPKVSPSESPTPPPTMQAPPPPTPPTCGPAGQNCYDPELGASG